jgi:Fic family protein
LAHVDLDLAVNPGSNHRMMRGKKTYLWQHPDWPHWRYDLLTLGHDLARVSFHQGQLIGRLRDLGFELKNQACLDALTEEGVQTCRIEGEDFNPQSVRSSIAHRLGMDAGALPPADCRVEGLVDVIMDATMNAHAPITTERLFAWHGALFPTGRSGLARIRVGAWRDDAQGPMQVVSGRLDQPVIHFEAPPAQALPKEIDRFLSWANTDSRDPALLKAGLAHLWFVTLHPFDDGNGRIARALDDLFLARADGSEQRFYSLSAQIEKERKIYYAMLETTQTGTLDVTEWLHWFLASLEQAIATAEQRLDQVLAKARFWHRWAGTPLNARQAKVINRLLDGFEGKLTNRRWASIAHCSSDTALRDIRELLALGLLCRLPGGGRSAAYCLAEDQGLAANQATGGQSSKKSS